MIAQLLKIDKRLIAVALIGSLLISIWANIVDDVVNNDGIEYIKSAQNMLDGQWRVALETYKWPFYAALMALVSKITFLSLEISAYLIDAISFVWVVVAFVALVRLLGGGRTELWLALVLILCFPTLNKFRPYLIRDPAFLALFLTAVYYYFAYFLEKKRSVNVMSIVFFGLSALFRIEGLIFLVASQAYLMVVSKGSKAAPWIAIAFTLILALVMIVLLSWWNFVPDGKLTYMSIFAHPIAFLETVWIQVLEQIGQRFHAIRSEVLVGYSHSYALVVLLWSAVTIVFFELMHALYYLYFGLFVVAVGRKEVFGEAQLAKPWRFLLIIAIGILCAFVLVQWFLSDRYPLAAAMLMLLPIPFLLAKWWRAVRLGATNRKSKIGFVVVMSLMVLAGLKSLDLATEKTYLKDAGKWLEHNIRDDATVHTNDRIIEHYFQRDAHVDTYWPYWKIYKDAALMARNNYDYLVFNVKHKDADYAINIPILMRSEPLRVFENEKGAKVLIIEMNNKRIYYPQSP